jgi:uncharacterized protein (DUF427 family)
VWLLLEHRRLPRYYFPEADIRRGLLVADRRSSRSQLKAETRHLDLRLGDRVVADGVVLADSRRTTAIFETAMGPRWYFPRQDIRVELLDGDAHTVCAYKGHATYWSVRLPSGLRENIAWSYPEPRHDAQAVGGRVAFFDEHVDLEVDGQPQPRPRTPWAAPRWWERMADLEARI